MNSTIRRVMGLALVGALLALAAPAPAWDETHAGRRARFQEAQEAAKRHPDVAVAIWAELAASDWPLADWAARRLIDRATETDAEAEANRWRRFLIDRFPASPDRPAAMLEYAEEALNQDPVGVADLMQRYLRDYPDREEARAQLWLGEALALIDRRQEAAVALGQAAWWGTNSWAVKAQTRLSDLQRAGYRAAPPSADGMWDRIVELYANRQYGQAAALAQRFATIFGGSARAFRAEMAAVDCLLARSRRQDAKELLEVVQRHAASADEKLAAAIRLKRFEKKLAAEKKRGFYLQAVEKPSGPQTRLWGRWALMELEWGEDRFAQAAYWAELLLKEHRAELFRADEALWRAGFAHFLVGRGDLAAARLKELLAAYPQHKDRDRAQYWLARALDKQGDRAGAVKAMRQCFDVWQGTYYGLAAEVWLLQWGVPAKDLPLLPFPDAKTATAGAPLLKAEWEQQGGGGQELDNGARLALDAYGAGGSADLAPVFRAFKEAYALGETDEAVRRLDAARDRAAASADGSYFLSVAYALTGEALASINAAGKAFEQVRDGKLADPHALTTKRRFPLVSRELVFPAAQKHGLDPWFVYGVIKQESAFQLRATSSAGARGLMQVMPGTGRVIAKRRGLKGYNPAVLYQPETSVDYGCWYLADLLSKLGNDGPAALAGYNAGIGRPRAWWPRFGDRLYDELLELIPIDETRGYVAAIVRNQEMYRRLYGDRAKIVAERPGAVALVAQPVKSLP